ncbi:hypothetical protein CO676_31340 [Sinorhizobium sp. BJ1]|nr:hypothetical protein CO676_31340 [Sinorhizobium sp. BJ1]
MGFVLLATINFPDAAGVPVHENDAIGSFIKVHKICARKSQTPRSIPKNHSTGPSFRLLVGSARPTLFRVLAIAVVLQERCRG